ncbi:MAG: type VI secretion system ATPase TssH [Phycisphaerae bacterium]
MAGISRAKVYGKLNQLAYKSLESAATFAKLRGNKFVEIAHWLNQILQLQDSDIHRIVRRFEINPSHLAADMTAALDNLPRGGSSFTDLSSDIDNAVKEAWGYATLMFGESQVRTGHIIVAIVSGDGGLKNQFYRLSKEWEKVKAEALTDEFAKIVGGSPEEAQRATDGSTLAAGAAPGETSGAVAPAAMGKKEALTRFSVDLTEKARKGEIDPIVGRDEEIRQIVDILMRRRQNNPILTGEAGVGKTAVVEGFALRIAAGDVPPSLKDVELRTLDLGLLQAGASMKGEFENRLRSVIDEVQASPTPIILFIDEAHTLIGAGGAAGSGDAANLLKPALARGTLRTIAATTWAEYKKYFEKDPALTRRFQVIQVGEPDEPKAMRMLRSLTSVLEKHHKVQILDEAIESAVKLSHRYIPARQLPDKAVSLLDTASARVAISQHATPARIDDCQKRIAALKIELNIIDRETEVGVEHADRRADIAEKIAAEEKRLAGLTERWNQEKALVLKVLELRAKLRTTGDQKIEQTADTAAPAKPKAAPPAAKDAKVATEANPQSAIPNPQSAEPPVDRTALLKELKDLQGKLLALQGEDPLILPTVDGQAVSSVVADWTGIPVGRMVKNEIETIRKLADLLERRVIGQRHALETIARRMQTSRAGLDNPNRPIGVFMLVGPSGVGKTETALALADVLYGGESNVITINMSEFQEAHTVSTLKGAPPGYVGYGEGGVLTEAVRRRPYSIVLLDEVEKAHPDVHEIFFQVFDKGWMEDGEGRFIDFKNTIILLTSNVGSDLIMNLCKDPDLLPAPEGIAKAMREPLLKKFPAALLGRLVVVPFYPISDAVLKLIVKLQLGRIEKRLAEAHKIPFTYDAAVVDLIASRCTEVESGARTVDAILTHTLLPQISNEYLSRLVEGKAITRVHIGADGKDFKYAFE